MPHHRISEIYKNIEKSFLQHLDHPEKLQEKGVHELRVDIKNLRVLLHLLEAVSKHEFRARSILKLLKPIFDRAGKMRTATLNIKLTQPYRSEVLLKYKKHLRVVAETERIKMQEEIAAFKIKKFRKLFKESLEVFKHLKKGRISKQGTEYLRVLLAEVRADIFDIADDETLHEIRHKLKDIKTVGKFMDECEIEHPFQNELKRIAITYDRIGLWHDTAILIEDLEDYVDDLEDDSALGKTTPLLVVLKTKNLHAKKLIEKRLRVDLVM